MKLIYEKLRDDAHAPTKEFPEDAGWDVRARTAFSLRPGMHMLVKLGLAMKLEPSPEQLAFATATGVTWYLRLADKSGLALKKGIHILGGVVDRNYRDEVGVIVANLGFWTADDKLIHEVWEVKPGHKVCQAVPELIWDVREAAPGVMGTSDRGSGAYGSTGV